MRQLYETQIKVALKIIVKEFSEKGAPSSSAKKGWKFMIISRNPATFSR
jgi:hypothetical protein